MDSLQVKVILRRGRLQFKLVAVGEDFGVSLGTEASKFSSLCGFAFSFGLGHETFIQGHMFAFDLHVDIIEGFGHEGANGAFALCLGEEGDDGIMDVNSHVTNPGCMVRVGGVIVDVEDLANKMSTEFSKLLIFPLLSGVYKLAVGGVEDGGGSSTNVTAAGDEGSAEVSFRDGDIGFSEAAETELPVGSLRLGRGEKRCIGGEAAFEAE